MRTDRMAISLKLGKLALSRLEGLQRLLVDRCQSFLLELAVARAGEDAVVARPGEIDLDDFLDPPRAGRHHHHSVGEEDRLLRSEEHTSELQSHSFISYAVFCL